MADPKTPVKASQNKDAVARRRKVFAERYLVNGNNATDAAKFAGLSPKTAYSAGQRMLNHPEVQTIIATRSQKIIATAELTTERWAKEMAAIGHFDPGELYDAEGSLIPIHLLPEHVRRAIGSVDVEQFKVGKGENIKTVSTTTKVKMIDKNTALANIGKHLGVFEKDNHQSREPIHVTVSFVGRPRPAV